MNYLNTREAIFLAHLNGCLYKADECIEKFPIQEFPTNERVNYYQRAQKVQVRSGLDSKGRIIFFNPFQEAKFVVYRQAS